MVRIVLVALLAFSSLSAMGQIRDLQRASDKARTQVSREGEKKIQQPAIDYTQYVDPFIGTGGHGHTYPGATVPFGMMQLSPDTRYEGWDGCSGYHYSDSVIYGFSHTHLSGTGVPDYGDLLIVPQSGAKAKTTPGYLDASKGYGHSFSHQDEKASPGFYQVNLKESGIHVRLTTTQHAGMHEYTFDYSEENKFILIDLDHRDKLLAQDFEVINNNEVKGFRISSAWASEQHFYFDLVCSVPFAKAKMITKHGQHKLLLQFPSETSKIMIRVGISGVDKEGAAKNLQQEMPDFQFEKYMLAAKNDWNSELKKIEASSYDEETMTIFYTGLYHTFLQPNLWNDVDGRYRGRDNAIHTLPKNESQYTVFSLWDTFRAAHPLYTIIQQKKTEDFLKTFLRQYNEGGDLPVWELAANETECMIGYNSVSVIADAYIKGIQPLNGRQLLSAMKATSQFDELGKRQFQDQGFISSGDEPESVSKTLEYAYDDFCIAQMAKLLRDKGTENQYRSSAFNFLNVYDQRTKFMRARDGAFWHEPFDPAEVNFNYTEANSWQYSLFAPHAIDVLSDRMGGKDSLEAWLDRLFTTKAELSGRHQADITGLIGQYAHGNEPSHHMAYLYNYTNNPSKTQSYVDEIQKEMYAHAPDGLSGNEDCGQMSAWYVMSAMGLYQVTPGYDWYDFGRPNLSKAIIHLENGNTLTINTKNNSSEAKYIQKASWNGTTLEKPGITHAELMKGGELVFEMGNSPSGNFKTPSTSCYQNSDLEASYFVQAPWFENTERVFENSTLVSVGSVYTNDKQVYYRYASDSMAWFTYETPFSITQSERVEITNNRLIKKADSPDKMQIMSTNWIGGSFIKREPGVHLELKTKYSPQYAGSGDATLIDGIQGDNEFRTGDYQGFYASDVEAIVEFDSLKNISKIGISTLQDMKSWIFYPSEIDIAVSYDGKTFTSIAKSKDFPSFIDYVGPTNTDVIVPVKPKSAIKAFRIIVKNYGKCPDWHLGKGNDTWLFLDEIIFE